MSPVCSTSWAETLKYASFHPDGAGLARRARAGYSISSRQRVYMEDLASQVRIEMMGENTPVPLNCLLSRLPITTTGIFYPECRIVRRGKWLVEGEGRPGVIGQIHEEKGIAVLYPNPHVPVRTLSDLFTQNREPQDVE